jgi:ribosomal protein S1
MPKKIETPATDFNDVNVSPENMDANPNTEETDSMEFDQVVYEAVLKPSDESEPKQKRRGQQTDPPAPVLTLEAGADVVTQREKENTIWHEIKNSQLTGTHLTGILGKMERLESGGIICIIDYKGQRIAIPLKEMMLDLNRPAGQSDEEYNERTMRVLNRMMGAQIDFVVRGITGSGEERAAVGSRKAAMHRLRRRYYLTEGVNGKPQVYTDRIVEARIVAVSQLAIRVEMFGVETSIRNRDLSWGYVGDCRDEYFVGDTVQVRVKGVEGDTPENLRIRADIKSLTEDDTREKLLALKPQTNCIGKVTDVNSGVVFINLVDGIRAISHKCFDHRKPGRGDDVLFVCTRIDEDGGVAIGIISRIIKRNL